MWREISIGVICVLIGIAIGAMTSYRPPPPPKPLAGQEITVGVWGGPYQEKFIEVVAKPFEEETGAKVTVVGVYFETIAEILAAPPEKPPYDVFIGDGYIVAWGLAENVLLPLRHENLPNCTETWDYLVRVRPKYKDYAIPFAVGFTSIYYNKDRIYELLGYYPSSWSVFLEPKVQGKFGMDSSWWYYAISGLALPDLNEFYDPESYKKFIEKVSKLNPRWYPTSADIVSALLRGDIILAQIYTDVMPAFVEHPEVWGWVIIPDEGSTSYIDYYMMARGAKRDVAEKFLNYLCSRETQQRFLNKQPWYVMGNKNVKPPEGSPIYDVYIKSEEEWPKKINLWDYEYIMPHYEELYSLFEKEVLRK